MFGIDAAIYVYCTYVFVENKNLKPETSHRAGYFSNLACDRLSIVWAYSEQQTENGPWTVLYDWTIIQ